ncbi:MAG: beta-lactamase family protein [Acidobacteria bacterium]|nr:beta-lactamase family protein [Acidobacteriota bacterium]
MCKQIISALILPFLAVFGFAADKPPEKLKAAQSIPELQQQLIKILADSHTPGVSVAIVHRDGPEWVTALGKADVASNRDATAWTLFRIGSTSKAFASLSILKLVREGKLTLNEPVHKLIPEIGSDNKWEATDPIRVVHLLEHTTGWDDLHLREYAKDAANMSLREALDFGRSSRSSRWRPGTRMAYCNSGPAVAAYIVEKVSGERFEDYVEHNFFQPIGMKTATYFKPDSSQAATLYHSDGKTPYRYWNITYRPAGSINASAQDMAAYVQFYLNRGAVNGTQLVPASEIDRMENPASTWAAREGLAAGYGLSNYWSFNDGFIFHGHNGGVEGGLTELAYMPEYGIGYFYSINSGNGDAFSTIGKAIRGYITLHLQRPPVPAAAALPSDAADYAGFYEPDSPRQEVIRFMDRLAGISRVHFSDGKMLISSLNGTNMFFPVSGHLFRYAGKDEPPEPAASAALLTPNKDGRFIQAGVTMKRLSTPFAFFEIALTTLVGLAMISILLYAPVWLLGGLFKKRRRPAERPMRLWPLLAMLCLIGFVAIFAASSGDIIGRLGNVTLWSLGIFASTLLFSLTSLIAAWTAWRARADGARRSVRIYSMIVSAALVLATIYLAYWGIIGLRTWV